MLSAATLIKDAIRLDYPIIESINSLLPYVDEYCVNIGESIDGTEAMISKHFGENKKVKLFFTKWEDKSFGTAFFCNQTNYVIDKCKGDYVFYIQADEVIHENDGNKIKTWIEKLDRSDKQGCTLDYLHFEKHPSLIRKTYKDGYDAYDYELRLFKNNGLLHSFGDGQSFCFYEDLLDPRGPQPALHRKERFLESDINIYHYGYLRDPKKLYNKKKELEEFYQVEHPDRKESIIKDKDGNYIFNPPEKLKQFNGTHPLVMKERLEVFK